jgi:thiol-disulfide isomerase/thioredoxin
MTHSAPTSNRLLRNLRLALLGFAGLGTALAAQAVPSDALYRGFQADGDLLLVVAGKELPGAEILLSDAARAYLVISPELPAPVLVNAAAATVETVDPAQITRQFDGSADLQADATLTPQGKYEVQETAIAFEVQGRPVVLRPRPWVLGKHTGAELLASNAGYRRGAKTYSPDAGIVKRLKSQKQPIRVLTFFGSWCPHCKRNLPLLLRVEEALSGSKFQFEYYGLPRPFDGDAEAKKHDVHSVPTAILFAGDEEVGRIPTTQWSNPEIALDLQLNGPGRKAR